METRLTYSQRVRLRRQRLKVLRTRLEERTRRSFIKLLMWERREMKV